MNKMYKGRVESKLKDKIKSKKGVTLTVIIIFVIAISILALTVIYSAVDIYGKAVKARIYARYKMVSDKIEKYVGESTTINDDGRKIYKINSNTIAMLNNNHLIERNTSDNTYKITEKGLKYLGVPGEMAKNTDSCIVLRELKENTYYLNIAYYSSIRGINWLSINMGDFEDGIEY